MSLSADQKKRVAELTKELYEIIGDSMHPDGHPMTFAELEDECNEVGDLLASAVLQERVGERSSLEELPSCPICDRQCEPPADDEARVLQTDRGEVGWMESTFMCDRCRRQFFPSDG